VRVFKKLLIGCLVLITISIGIFGKTILLTLNQIYEDKLNYWVPAKEYLIETPGRNHDSSNKVVD